MNRSVTPRRRPSAAAFLILATAAAADGQDPAAPDPAAPEAPGAEAPAVDFARDVQPLLARRCLACHGPDDAEGGLMLGSRETALAVTDGGEPAILPGDAAHSPLLERVASNSEWDRMPPEGDRLTPEEVDLLRNWIDGGANWEAHWAFQPPVVADPPAVATTAPVRNPIDNFVAGPAGRRGAGAEPAGGPGDAAPPAVVRPDRPAPDPGANRRLRRRGRPGGRPGCLRESRRPAARLAPLRGEVGPALARPGPLRRRRTATNATATSRTPGSTATT